MTKRLKVYRMNYDGTNERMVAAGSKREAAKLMGTTLHQFNNYGGEDGREQSVTVAISAPREVWQRKIYFGPKAKQPAWELVDPKPTQDGAGAVTTAQETHHGL